MNIVTGCSGIDAIAYAALLLDIELIGQIEIDNFCNTILELRYPGVKRYKDIFNVRGDEFGAVDIFGFGDPCQPHSVAGKQKGTADDRYIWPEIFRVIKAMRPTWIINENVVGSVSNGVVRDKILQLESERYRAKAFIVPACAVGAPHQRERVFIVGNSRYEQSQKRRKSTEECKRQTCNESAPPNSVVADSTSSQRESRREKQGILREVFENEREFNYTDGPSETRETMADTDSEHSQNCDTATCRGKQGIINGSVKETRADRSAQSAMGRNVDGLSGGLHRHGGQEDSSRILGAFEEIFTATLDEILWPAGYGAEQYDYEPPRVATGVKNRTNRLKALGNAIVPWQIMPILLAIKLIERYGYEHE